MKTPAKKWARFVGRPTFSLTARGKAAVLDASQITERQLDMNVGLEGALHLAVELILSAYLAAETQVAFSGERPRPAAIKARAHGIEKKAGELRIHIEQLDDAFSSEANAILSRVNGGLLGKFDELKASLIDQLIDLEAIMFAVAGRNSAESRGRPATNEPISTAKARLRELLRHYNPDADSAAQDQFIASCIRQVPPKN